MKILLSFVFIISFLSSKSQVGQRIFQKPEMSGPEYAGPIVETPSGNLLFAVNTSNYGNQNTNILLHRLDAQGNRISSNVIGGDGSDSAVAMIVTPNKEIFIAGCSNSNPNGLFSFSLTKVDQLGGKYWTKNFSRSRDEFCAAITVLPNGDLLLSGTTKTGTTKENFKVMRVTTSGSLVWEKTWDKPLSQVCNDAIIVAGINIYLVGTEYTDTSNNGCIFCLNFSGDSLWTKTYYYTQGNSEFKKIQYIPSQNKLLIGGAINRSFSNPSILLSTIDRNGTLIYTPAIWGGGHCKDLKYVSDTSIYLLTTSENLNSNQYDSFLGPIELIKMDTSLITYIFDYSLSDRFVDIPHSIYCLRNGNIVLSRTVTSFFTSPSPLINSQSSAASLAYSDSNLSYNSDSILITSASAISACSTDSFILEAPIGYSKYFWFLNDQPISTIDFHQHLISGINTSRFSTLVFSLIAIRGDKTFYSNKLILFRDRPPSVDHADQSIGFCQLDTLNGNFYPGSWYNSNCTYQWFRNDTLQINDTLSYFHWPNQNGIYRMVATNQCGVDTSGHISTNSNSIPSTSIIDTLRYYGVNGIPCWTQSMGLSNNLDNYISRIQWYKNNVLQPNDTLKYYQPQTIGNFYCTVSNSCGVDTSNIAHVVFSTNEIINPLISIPSPGLCGDGYPTIVTNLAPATNRTWNTPQQFSQTYFTTSCKALYPGNYSLTTYSGCASLPPFVSNVISVNPSIYDRPQISPTPDKGYKICRNDSLLLSISINSAQVSYQWYKDGFPIPNATSQNYWAKGAASTWNCKVFTSQCGFQISDSIWTDSPSPELSFSDCKNPILRARTDEMNISTYKWYRNNLFLSSSPTSNTYQCSMSGIYSCTVYMDCGDSIILNSVTVPDVDSVNLNYSTKFICPNINQCLLSAPSFSNVQYQWFSINGNNISQIGSNSSTLSINTPGMYYSIYYNRTYSCYATTDIVTILPDVPYNTNIINTYNNGICNGSAATLTTNTNQNYSYQWLLNSSPINGSTNPTLTTSTPGYYSVIITSPTCSDTSTTYQLLDSVLSPLEIISPTEHLLCQGASVTLQSNLNAMSYQWYFNNSLMQGATSSTLTTNSTGIYSCQVTSINGCIGEGATSIIDQNSIINKSIYGAKPQICFGDSSMIQITNNSNASSYQWHFNNNAISGANQYYHFGLDTGFYYCEANSNCGTFSSDTFHLETYPIPINTSTGFSQSPQLCINNPSVIIADPVLYAETYQWMLPPSIHFLSQNYLRNIIVQPDNNFSNGTIEVTGLNKCGIPAPSSSSINVQIDFGCLPIFNPSSGNKVSKSNLEIFPNPSSNNFTIQLNGEDVQSVLILNSIGKIVNTFINPLQDIVFGDDLSPGIYFIKIQNASDVITQTIIKL